MSVNDARVFFAHNLGLKQAAPSSTSPYPAEGLMKFKHYIWIALLPLSCCLRIVSFEGPALLLPGDSAYLRCLFELGGERLYSVKWYKDAKEFYRYHPQLNPQFMAFQAPGINVDLTRSGHSTVYLRNVSVWTEGRFTCQVSADEPHFGCVQAHKDITVHVPPETSPEIEAGLTDSGDNVTVTCSTPKSKPAANISWHLNDGMTIPEGAYASQEVFRHQDLLESSSSKLDIPLDSMPEVLRLQCEAIIPDLVTAVSRELVLRRPNLQPRSLEVANEVDKAACTRSKATIWLCAVPLILLLWVEFIK